MLEYDAVAAAVRVDDSEADAWMVGAQLRERGRKVLLGLLLWDCEPVLVVGHQNGLARPDLDQRAAVAARLRAGVPTNGVMAHDVELDAPAPVADVPDVISGTTDLDEPMLLHQTVDVSSRAPIALRAGRDRQVPA